MGVLYIPPTSCCVTYNRHMNLVKNVCKGADKDTNIILYGDFNLPTLNWMQSDIFENTFIPINVSNPSEEITIEICNEIGLLQVNNVTNDNNHILDLLWTNEPDNCICRICDNNILYNEVHHKALKVDLETQFSVSHSPSKEFYMDFANADYNKINMEINSIDWCKMFSDECPLNSKVDKFYAIINKIIENNVQKKELKKSNHPIWFDSKAINLKNRINRMHKKMNQ